MTDKPKKDCELINMDSHTFLEVDFSGSYSPARKSVKNFDLEHK